MKISKKFELRLLLIILLFTFLCFLFLLINTYGMNHFLDDKNNLLEENFNKAKKDLEKDFVPIDDMRASKDYRMEIAKNLLMKCFIEIKNHKLIRLN